MQILVSISILILFSTPTWATPGFCKDIFKSDRLAIEKVEANFTSKKTPAKLSATSEVNSFFARLITESKVNRNLSKSDYLNFVELEGRLPKINFTLKKWIKRASTAKQQGVSPSVSDFEIQNLALLLRPIAHFELGFFRKFVNYNLPKETKSLFANRAEQLITARKIKQTLLRNGFAVENSNYSQLRERLARLKPVIKVGLAVGANLGFYQTMLGIESFLERKNLPALVNTDFFIPIYVPELNLAERKSLTDKALEVYESQGAESLYKHLKTNNYPLISAQNSAQLLTRYPQALISAVLGLGLFMLVDSVVIPGTIEAYDNYKLDQVIELEDQIFSRNVFLQTLLVKPEQIDTLQEIHELGDTQIYSSFTAGYTFQHSLKKIDLKDPVTLQAWTEYRNDKIELSFRGLALEIYQESGEFKGEEFLRFEPEHLRSFGQYLNSESIFKNLTEAEKKELNMKIAEAN